MQPARLAFYWRLAGVLAMLLPPLQVSLTAGLLSSLAGRLDPTAYQELLLAFITPTGPAVQRNNPACYNASQEYLAALNDVCRVQRIYILSSFINAIFVVSSV